MLCNFTNMAPYYPQSRRSKLLKSGQLVGEALLNVPRIRLLFWGADGT